MAELLDGLETLIIAEEGDPVVENAVRAFAQKTGSQVKIYGKSGDGIFHPYGEIEQRYRHRRLGQGFGVADKNRRQGSPSAGTCRHGDSPGLPPYARAVPTWVLIQPCGKCSKNVRAPISSTATSAAMSKGVTAIFSAKDVANDEAGKKYPVTSPYEILDTIYVMGSGIGIALGQAKAGYKEGKVMAVAGDSTFIHATLPAVVDAVYNNADITFVILDNYWTCMTGHQSNPNTVYNPGGSDLPGFDIEAAVRAMGIQSVGIASSYDRKAAVEVLTEALNYPGPAVVILTGECQLQLQRRVKKGMAKTEVDQGLCNGCKLCVQLGCPAIKYDMAARKSSIDPISCTDLHLMHPGLPAKRHLDGREIAWNLI